MKFQIRSLLILALMFSFACSKNQTEPTKIKSLDLSNEKSELTEYEGDLFEVEPRKYCEWTVTSTVGDSCKYSKGDVICYRCNDDGCPPGIISVGRNFGDGCRTFGEFTDTDCEEKEEGDCAGKYLGS